MASQSIRRDVNDISTWVYPNIPNGVTVVRKEDVSEDEIYAIYKDCIEIQRNAYIRSLNREDNKLPHSP